MYIEYLYLFIFIFCLLLSFSVLIIQYLLIVYSLLFVKIVRNEYEYQDKFLICVNVFGNIGIPPSELFNEAREREVWGPLLGLLPPQPDPG